MIYFLLQRPSSGTMAYGLGLLVAAPILSGWDIHTHRPAPAKIKNGWSKLLTPLRARDFFSLAFFSRLFNFPSFLPRSHEPLPKNAEKLHIIKKIRVSNLADLLNSVINEILVNVIKKIFICPGKTGTRDTDINISLFAQLSPPN